MTSSNRILAAAIMYLAATDSFPLYARPVIDAARIPTVGCYKRDDIATIIHAGIATGGDFAQAYKRITGLIKSKIATHQCFSVAIGQMAYQAPEWQRAHDIGSGIALMKTESGRNFYTAAFNWQYVQDAPNFVH
jgi:hypothetical protein